MISGLALDAAGNQPLNRVVVTLSTMETHPQDAVAWTDAAGRFGFGNLRPGKYQLRANKEGFRFAWYGADTPFRPQATITLAAGEARADCNFRMQRLGAISGVVLDDTGDPAPGAQVQALTPRFQRQRRILAGGPSVMTDSSGHYRFFNLVAGDYAISIAGINQPFARSGPDVAAGQPPVSYAYGVQYYPGTDQAASASLVHVQPGKEAENIDLHLQAKPLLALEGTVIVPAELGSIPNVMVMVSGQDAMQRMNMGAGANAPTYMFHFTGFPAGQYMVTAQATANNIQYRGVLRLALGEQPATGITIPLEKGVPLNGSVTMEGRAEAGAGNNFVSLMPGDSIPINGPPLRAEVKKDGTFTFSSVAPGVWDINVGSIPPGGYLKSMRLGDRDVLANEMVITPATTAALKIVVGAQAGAVTGEVVAKDGQPARASVLLAPEGALRAVPSYFRTGVSDDQGHFEMKGIAPGSYKAYAFPELDPSSAQDPDFLKRYERSGTPLEIKEGPNTTGKVTLIEP